MITYIKNMAKICLVKFLYIILHFFMFLPIKKNRIFLMNNHTQQYACNPKYIFEYLYKYCQDKFDFVWCCDNFPLTFDNRIKNVKTKSLQYIIMIMTSKIIIGNAGFSVYIPYRKKQVLINTWHGGGAYKKVGIVNADKMNWLYYEFVAKYTGKKTTYFLSSCKRFSEVMCVAECVDYSKFISSGMPRNDIFFNNKIINEKKQNIHNCYNIPKNKTIVLYAPTYRGALINTKFDFILDITRTRNAFVKLYKRDCFVLLRTHHYTSNIIHQEMINVSNYPDMQELLCSADILITDYSSCMWDFSLLKRPCFIFAPDIQSYKSERDFYTPMEQWPFPIAQTDEELEKNILSFSTEKYCTAIDKHHTELGIYENGSATKTICDIILDAVE